MKATQVRYPLTRVASVSGVHHNVHILMRTNFAHLFSSATLVAGLTACGGGSPTQKSTAVLTVVTPAGGRVVSSAAGIDCGTDCTESYELGTSITLTASPVAGYQFKQWLGPCTATGTTCTLVLQDSVQMEALFEPATLAGCMLLPSTAQQLTGAIRGLCYGTEKWVDPTVNIELRQEFDFWPATQQRSDAPLVIWAHPNGQTHDIADDQTAQRYQRLIKPALDNGFAFASIEFRHPVTNENIVPAPHLDVAHVIQYIRVHADRLGIDPNNVFIIAQSRGTLGLWTALQDNMADASSEDPVRRQSTRVNAVFAVQAQTTYDGLEFADLFVAQADQEQAKASWKIEHPQYALFGSAIKSVDANDPPVLLRYETGLRSRPLTLADLAGGADTIHYPNMGQSLCEAYQRAGAPASQCQVFFNVPPQQGFDGYIGFFQAHLKR